MDPRHKQRIKIIEELYSLFFSNKPNISQKTKAIIANKKIIDEYIKKYAKKFSIEKIAKIDLAILRLSIYELKIEKKEPAKVIINEAVELAKEYGSERSYAFINGVLAKVYQDSSFLSTNDNKNESLN